MHVSIFSLLENGFPVGGGRTLVSLLLARNFFFLFFTLFCNDSIEQTKGVPQQNCVSASAEGCHLKRS